MLETHLQIAGEVARSIAVYFRIGGLDLIQHGANLRGRHRRVRQISAELLERFLEVGVVFPERIVGVEDQVLWRQPSAPHRQRPARCLTWPFKGATRLASTTCSRCSM